MSTVYTKAGADAKFAPTAHTHAEADVTGLTSDLAGKVSTASKGVANGVASLDSTGTVPRTQLPPVQGVSNYTDLSLRRWRAALATTLSGQGLCRIAWIGDSITTGVGTTSITAPWPYATGRMLASRGIAHAYGASPPQNGYTTWADSRYAFSGGQASAGGVVFWSSIAQGQSVTFTSTEPGTIVEYLWSNGVAATNSISVQIDGGAATTVNGNGSGNATVTRVTGLSNTVHTVKITATAGACIFGYIAVLPDHGVVMDNWGYAGSKTSDWTAQAGWDLRSFPVWQVVPNLAIIALGTNDVAQSVSAATYQANIQTIVAGFQAINVDVLLVCNVPIDGTHATGYPSDWTAYRAALGSVSTSLNVPLLDLGARWNNDGPGAFALGLLNTDGFHPTNAGAADIATAVLPVIAGGGGTDSISVAEQAALDLKADKANPTFTGTVIAPTPATSDSSTKVATTAYVKAQSAPLARVVYNPATAGSVTVSTSIVDVDATNLAITFTAPSSGNVRVALEAAVTPASSDTIWWLLREGTTNLAGTGRLVAGLTSSTSKSTYRIRVEIAVTGLTPGSSHTYKWGHYSSTNSSSVLLRGGTEFSTTANGPAIMAVYAE